MNIYDRLDTIHMSAIDREHAKAHMRSAELTIDFVAAAVGTTRSVSAALGQHLINLARRFQVSDRQAVQCRVQLELVGGIGAGSTLISGKSKQQVGDSVPG